MSLLDMFSGGAFSNASIFALGIMPYISASIVMQLLAVAVPYFQRCSVRERVAVKDTMVYSCAYSGNPVLAGTELPVEPPVAGKFFTCQRHFMECFIIPATIILAAGSMFILWLGERITDKVLEWYLSDHHDRYYCPSASGFHAGGWIAFHRYLKWWIGDVHC